MYPVLLCPSKSGLFESSPLQCKRFVLLHKDSDPYVGGKVKHDEKSVLRKNDLQNHGQHCTLHIHRKVRCMKGSFLPTCSAGPAANGFFG